VLLLGAFLPELAPLRTATALGDGLRGRVGALDVAARVVGIGLPTAAAGAAMQLDELRPRAVVAIGTCGVYPEATALLAIGEVAVPRHVRLIDASVVAGLAQFPEPMSRAREAHQALAEGLERAGGRHADVGTTLAITVDDAIARQIALAAAVQVEHLEAFGVAAACAARGVPFAAALGIANSVGARARDEWRLHHRAAAAAAVDVVLRWIRQAATLP
jgi:nucleoside phosphorylase